MSVLEKESVKSSAYDDICELWGLGVGGDIEIEEDWGDAGPLGDSCVYMSVRGCGVIVAAAGLSPTKVSGKPAYRVMSECCL